MAGVLLPCYNKHGYVHDLCALYMLWGPRLHEHVFLKSLSGCVCFRVCPDTVYSGKCEEKGMAEQLCGNYTTITDRLGRNALKGAIAYEGFAECEFVCLKLDLRFNVPLMSCVRQVLAAVVGCQVGCKVHLDENEVASAILSLSYSRRGGGVVHPKVD